MTTLAHGHGRKGARTPTYSSWMSMRARCCNSNSPDYPRYGGRGILICERWGRFENFLADMGERPRGTTLERRENDGHYEPGNCRWATRMEQRQNTSANRVIEFRGERLSLSEWSRRMNISAPSLAWRLDRWSLEDAMTRPSRSHSPQESIR